MRLRLTCEALDELLMRQERVVGQAQLAGLRLPVGDEPLEVADGQRLEFLGEDAGALALVLLRAHAAADRGQRVVLFDDRQRPFEILLLDRGHDLFGGPKTVSLTLAPGRYYAVVERLFPKDIPDPSVFYTIVLTN